MDTANWLEPFLRAVFSTAPHTWPDATLSFFPAPLRQLCVAPSHSQSKAALISKVEEEYKKFKSTFFFLSKYISLYTFNVHKDKSKLKMSKNQPDTT